jgi:hypothetical protein
MQIDTGAAFESHCCALTDYVQLWALSALNMILEVGVFTLSERQREPRQLLLYLSAAPKAAAAGCN